jgi:hypothetical protein
VLYFSNPFIIGSSLFKLISTVALVEGGVVIARCEWVKNRTFTCRLHYLVLLWHPAGFLTTFFCLVCGLLICYTLDFHGETSLLNHLVYNTRLTRLMIIILNYQPHHQSSHD